VLAGRSWRPGLLTSGRCGFLASRMCSLSKCEPLKYDMARRCPRAGAQARRAPAAAQAAASCASGAADTASGAGTTRDPAHATRCTAAAAGPLAFAPSPRHPARAKASMLRTACERSPRTLVHEPDKLESVQQKASR